MPFLCLFDRHSSCWICRGLPWFLPVWLELRTSISTSTGASPHRCMKPGHSAPALVQKGTWSAQLMRLQRRSSRDRQVGTLPYLPLTGSYRVDRDSGISRLMKERSNQGLRVCSFPYPRLVGNCPPCTRFGTTPPLRVRDALPWQGCMIAGHRTTGTDQLGMVSGLMTLECR